MNPILRQITQRMSLRAPLAASLEILSRLADRLPMSYEASSDATIQKIQEAFPQVLDFERSFPNVCFAIATGVGKTRLMGAMIAYLAQDKNIKNFVVIAPNNTITEKLVREFSNSSDPKYIFKGLPEFTNSSPRIVTGDTYEEGTGLFTRQVQESFDPESITINVFNISLLHAKDRRIRRRGERIDGGLSYFEYLAQQKDLVIFMDEAHRYRATAAARTIDELKPALGIELTATPQVQEGKRTISFRNVIYRFNFKEAHEAGYVKRVGISGRNNVDYSTYTEDALERLKLEDGLNIHRQVQIHLDDYVYRKELKTVKPFMLVIAKDTDHAERLRILMESTDFLNGHYAGKVRTVHSNQDQEEQEETVRTLLAIESPDNPIEIVIHVNMLREGWDVTNLYTIVPLRKADSRTLVEQSIGRGARLPFGKRTGVDVIDRLYIIAHERFNKIIDELREEDLPPPELIPIPAEKETRVVVLPVIQPLPPNTPFPSATPTGSVPDPEGEQHETEIFSSSQAIEIPRLILSPDPNARPGKFRLFDLNILEFRPKPEDSSIIVMDKFDGTMRTFYAKPSMAFKNNPRDRLAAALLDYDDVAEAEDNEMIVCHLAEQMVKHLRSYSTEEQISFLLNQYQDAIAHYIHQQMVQHYQAGEENLVYSYGKGFLTFKNASYLVTQGDKPLPYQCPHLPEGRRIETILWSDFQKSIYPLVKFDSQSERLFASCLESDEAVLRWVKPPRDSLPIAYSEGTHYEPDFVVETQTGKFLCEVKDKRFLEDPVVHFKMKAAIHWCGAASQYGKPWSYLLIPHDQVDLLTSFASYSNRFQRGP